MGRREGTTCKMNTSVGFQDVAVPLLRYQPYSAFDILSSFVHFDMSSGLMIKSRLLSLASPFALGCSLSSSNNAWWPSDFPQHSAPLCTLGSVCSQPQQCGVSALKAGLPFSSDGEPVKAMVNRSVSSRVMGAPTQGPRA